MKLHPTPFLACGAAFAALCAGATGPAGAWTLKSATSCNQAGSYAYASQVTIVTGATAQNTLMSVTGEWRPSPGLTTIKIDTMGRGSVSVRRLCVRDPWAVSAPCTDQNVAAQSNPAWGLAQILKAAPDVLAPKNLLPSVPAKIPVPVITSEAWGTGGLPLVIRVSGLGPRCAMRFDEMRVPGGKVYKIGPSPVGPSGAHKIAAQQIQFYKLSGPYALRSQIALWTGSEWRFGGSSPWFAFQYAPTVKRAPPGSVQPVPQGPARPKP